MSTTFVLKNGKASNVRFKCLICDCFVSTTKGVDENIDKTLFLLSISAKEKISPEFKQKMLGIPGSWCRECRESCPLASKCSITNGICKTSAHKNCGIFLGIKAESNQVRSISQVA